MYVECQCVFASSMEIVIVDFVVVWCEGVNVQRGLKEEVVYSAFKDG